MYYKRRRKHCHFSEPLSVPQTEPTVINITENILEGKLAQANEKFCQEAWLNCDHF